jgi:hypothetical protein
MIRRLTESPGRPGTRIPPNLFGIASGLAGPAAAWHAARPLLGRPARYRPLPTSTASYAAAVTDAADWLTAKKPPAAAACATTVFTAVTVLISAITARRGQSFPAPPRAAVAGLEHEARPPAEPVRA